MTMTGREISMMARIQLQQEKEEQARLARRLLVKAAMHRVTIPDGQEPEGAVAGLIEVSTDILDSLLEHWGPVRGVLELQAALARFELDDTEPAD